MTTRTRPWSAHTTDGLVGKPGERSGKSSPRQWASRPSSARSDGGPGTAMGHVPSARSMGHTPSTRSDGTGSMGRTPSTRIDRVIGEDIPVHLPRGSNRTSLEISAASTTFVPPTLRGMEKFMQFYFAEESGDDDAVSIPDEHRTRGQNSGKGLSPEEILQLAKSLQPDTAIQQPSSPFSASIPQETLKDLATKPSEKSLGGERIVPLMQIIEQENLMQIFEQEKPANDADSPGVDYGSTPKSQETTPQSQHHSGVNVEDDVCQPLSHPSNAVDYAEAKPNGVPCHFATAHVSQGSSKTNAFNVGRVQQPLSAKSLALTDTASKNVKLAQGKPGQHANAEVKGAVEHSKISEMVKADDAAPATKNAVGTASPKVKMRAYEELVIRSGNEATFVQNILQLESDQGKPEQDAETEVKRAVEHSKIAEVVTADDSAPATKNADGSVYPPKVEARAHEESTTRSDNEATFVKNILQSGSEQDAETEFAVGAAAINTEMPKLFAEDSAVAVRAEEEHASADEAASRTSSAIEAEKQAREAKLEAATGFAGQWAAADSVPSSSTMSQKHASDDEDGIEDVFDEDDGDWAMKQQIQFAVVAGDWAEALQLSSMMESASRQRDDITFQHLDVDELHTLVQEALRAEDYEAVTNFSQQLATAKRDASLRHEIKESLKQGDWAHAAKLSSQLANACDPQASHSLNLTPVSHGLTPHPPLNHWRPYHSAPRQRRPLSHTSLRGRVQDDEAVASRGHGHMLAAGAAEGAKTTKNEVMAAKSKQAARSKQEGITVEDTAAEVTAPAAAKQAEETALAAATREVEFPTAEIMAQEVCDEIVTVETKHVAEKVVAQHIVTEQAAKSTAQDLIQQELHEACKYVANEVLAAATAEAALAAATREVKFATTELMVQEICDDIITVETKHVAEKVVAEHVATGKVAKSTARDLMEQELQEACKYIANEVLAEATAEAAAQKSKIEAEAAKQAQEAAKQAQAAPASRDTEHDATQRMSQYICREIVTAEDKIIAEEIMAKHLATEKAELPANKDVERIPSSVAQVADEGVGDVDMNIVRGEKSQPAWAQLIEQDMAEKEASSNGDTDRDTRCAQVADEVVRNMVATAAAALFGEVQKTADIVDIDYIDVNQVLREPSRQAVLPPATAPTLSAKTPSFKAKMPPSLPLDQIKAQPRREYISEENDTSVAVCAQLIEQDMAEKEASSNGDTDRDTRCAEVADEVVRNMVATAAAALFGEVQKTADIVDIDYIDVNQVLREPSRQAVLPPATAPTLSAKMPSFKAKMPPSLPLDQIKAQPRQEDISEENDTSVAVCAQLSEQDMAEKEASSNGDTDRDTRCAQVADEVVRNMVATAAAALFGEFQKKTADIVDIDYIDVNQVLRAPSQQASSQVMIDERIQWKAEAKTQVVQEDSVTIAKKGSILIEVIIDMDFWTALQSENFNAGLVEDLARALGGIREKVKVLGIRSGSVIAHVLLEEGLFVDGSDPVAAFDMLIQQLGDKTSLLKQGLLTKNVIAIRLVAENDVVAGHLAQAGSEAVDDWHGNVTTGNGSPGFTLGTEKAILDIKHVNDSSGNGSPHVCLSTEQAQRILDIKYPSTYGKPPLGTELSPVPEMRAATETEGEVLTEAELKAQLFKISKGDAKSKRKRSSIRTKINTQDLAPLDATALSLPACWEASPKDFGTPTAAALLQYSELDLLSRTVSSPYHEPGPSELDAARSSEGCEGNFEKVMPPKPLWGTVRAGVEEGAHRDLMSEGSDAELEDGERIDDYTEEELQIMRARVWIWLRAIPHHSAFQQPTLQRQSSFIMERTNSSSGIQCEGTETQGAVPAIRNWEMRRQVALTRLKALLNDRTLHEEPGVQQARNESFSFVHSLYKEKMHHLIGEVDTVIMNDKYNHRSLFLFRLDNVFRRASIAIVEWPAVDYFIMFIIFANIVTMALEDPLSPVGGQKREVIDMCNMIFIIIFAIEAALKILAYGFVLGPQSYLKDPWNWIDLLVVITGLLDAFGTARGSENRALSSFRLLRPLRILRAIGRVSKLRVLVSLIILCAAEMINVIALVLVLLLLVGITGFLVWQGALRGRCFHILLGTIIADAEEFLCPMDSNPIHTVCPPDFQCLGLGKNPAPGVVHFDYIGTSILSIFQVITAQGWVDMMWNVSTRYTNPIFIALILAGPLFLLKLIMVVIANRYAAVKMQRISELTRLTRFELRVGIIEAEVPRMDLFGASDPYVLIQMDNVSKKTRVIKNTLHPEWHEYHILPVGNSTSFLRLKMFDWNRIGAHEFIGQIEIPVGNMDDSYVGSDRWYEMTELDAGAAAGTLRVQLQWRKNIRNQWSEIPTILAAGQSDKEVEKQNFSSVMFSIAKSQTLSIIMIATVFFNFFIMALEHDCSAEEYCTDFRYVIELLNVLCSVVFAIEMVVKLCGIGFINYCKDSANMLYVIVVVISMVEIPFIVRELSCLRNQAARTGDGTWNPYHCEGSAKDMSFIRMFRLIRLLRIGRLIEYVPLLRQHLTVMARTVDAVTGLIGLMTLVVVAMAIWGMYVFGGLTMLSIDSMDVTTHGTTLEIGCMVRFLIPANLTAEDTYIQTFASGMYTGKLIEVDLSKFPNSFLVARYETNETFLAQLQSNVTLSTVSAFKRTIDGPRIIGLVPRSNFDNFWNAVITTFQIMTLANWHKVWYSVIFDEYHILPFFYFFFAIVIGNYTLLNLFAAIIVHAFAEQREELNAELKGAQERAKAERERAPDLIGRTRSSESNDYNGSIEPARGFSSKIASVFCCACCFMRGGKVRPEDRDKVPNPEDRDKVPNPRPRLTRLKSASSLFLFDPDGSFRAREVQSDVAKFVYVGYIFLFLTLVDNMILILFQGLLVTSDSTLETQIVKYSSTFFLVLAGVDLIIRSQTVQTSWRWNVIDVLVMVLTIPEVLTLWTGHLAFLEPAFLFFRALRPLRIIVRSPSMQAFSERVAACSKEIGSALIMMMFCFTVMGIIGVNLFSGRMKFCTDLLIRTKEECTGLSRQGVPRLWKSHTLNFDWVGQGMATFFVVATRDTTWAQLMYQAVDISESRGLAPNHDANPGFIFLYVAIVFVGGLFLLNTITGVVVDAHNSLTHKQMGAVTTMTVNSGTNDKKVPRDPLRKKMMEFVLCIQFDIMILVVIVLDICSMAFLSYKASTSMMAVYSGANVFFTCIYASEAMAKLYAFHAHGYYQNSWNSFELFLVIISIWGISLEQPEILQIVDSRSFSGESIVPILRIFRAIRVIRLLHLQIISSLHTLVRALIPAANHIVQVFGALFVIYLIFGNSTVALFGHLCASSDMAYQVMNRNILTESEVLMPRCLLVDEQDLLHGFAFSNVGRALATLLAMNTGDAWSNVMRSLALSPGMRKSGDTAVVEARIQLIHYFQTRDVGYLQEARAILPGCQTSEELDGLSDVLDCNVKSGGKCVTTCGNSTLAFVVCILFICITSLVMFNVLLAVLMRSLQVNNKEPKRGQVAIARGQDARNAIHLLMSTSKAAANWRVRGAGSYLWQTSDLESTNSAPDRVMHAAEGTNLKKQQ